MPKHKGNSTTNIFTPQGRENYDHIRKACGCAMGRKCACVAVGPSVGVSGGLPWAKRIAAGGAVAIITGYDVGNKVVIFESAAAKHIPESQRMAEDE